MFSLEWQIYSKIDYGCIKLWVTKNQWTIEFKWVNFWHANFISIKMLYKKQKQPPHTHTHTSLVPESRVGCWEEGVGIWGSVWWDLRNCLQRFVCISLSGSTSEFKEIWPRAVILRVQVYREWHSHWEVTAEGGSTLTSHKRQWSEAVLWARPLGLALLAWWDFSLWAVVSLTEMPPPLCFWVVTCASDVTIFPNLLT